MTQSSSASSIVVDRHHFLSGSLWFDNLKTLSYSEESRHVIHDHVVALVAAFPSLHPTTGLFTYNDGATTTLLYIEGTLLNTSTTINIELSISIWLLEYYPMIPPSVFVSFPLGTVARRHHHLVDASGAVTIPYLSSWDFQFSNLIDLVRSITRLFNNEPPFYITDEAKKKSMVNDILKTVEKDLEAIKASQVAELELMFDKQSVLKKRGNVVETGLQKLEKQKDQLEQQLQIVLMNCDVLRIWIQENYQKLRRCSCSIDIDEVLIPANTLSKQRMECIAHDNAIEDTIYELDMLLREGCVSSSEYFKNVRALSREQFFRRATVMKLCIQN